MEQITAPEPGRTARAQKAEASCPHCGEPGEADQLVCLHCGGRVGLDYRRPPGWKLPAAIVAIVALLAVAGFGFGLREITHKARTEVGDPGPATTKPKPARSAKPDRPAADKKKPAAK